MNFVYFFQFQLSAHARMQMQRRRISLDDVALTLRFGEHVEGREEGTREACTELEGRSLTVVYDSARYESGNLFHVVTVLRRGCEQ